MIGHPFNPPHLIPLVEVVPGERTSEAAVEQALDFYAAVGKRPIRLRQELPGHVANRLQGALWREAYSLVERGVASVADIDTAIALRAGAAVGGARAVRQPAPVGRRGRTGACAGSPRTADGRGVAGSA